MKYSMQNYFIWSWEHNAWWRPNSSGYTSDVLEAGVYSYRQALKIVRGANINFNRSTAKMPNEAMVPAP